ncbi:hypothetical protein HBH56_200530 [Parastagonospora nodorum]|uniref:Uncharacterized protein n=1 Tax=Phaeosphaeria nodorum (strain SN15 / ATCC MYA-4574 / FGSC 10173) TaxID=321614 RepID=A0A7U2I2D4_PHANO|nr:hypothetical protein HBH56_200530 [Parastagonospora nodorum]QRD00786.1 hypothetical protein JI435_415780 [Parastagonospora nodorum SN15]KAH3925898.1 hypothetical protein HBH54_175770 [Parastagonospora nodorum]KAH3952962.1 hypothetical protein HBH53_037150 [Parastagonospora nodorum]KAH4000319.1 hypothetical protein HBI10_100070 [Parastagonospora nodorum]
MRGMDLPRIAICSVLLVVTTTQLYAFSDSRQRYPGRRSASFSNAGAPPGLESHRPLTRVFRTIIHALFEEICLKGMSTSGTSVRLTKSMEA